MNTNGEPDLQLPTLQHPQQNVAGRLMRPFDGPLTRQLLLNPGQHGLGMTHPSLAADATTTVVCGYCSTGCGLRIHLREGRAIGLTPETQYPVNMGMACPKGWEALRVLEADDRAVAPLVRGPDGNLSTATWGEALHLFCNSFKRIQAEHGPHSVAFLSTGQIACEEMALLGALAKFGMGMLHGDGNTRQCMATAATAYKESFGFDAPPYCYDDFEQSDCLVFVGSNLCVGHPILWERVLRNSNNPQILVLDPRRTETAMAATEHLQLRPKSDLVLLYGITNLIIQNDQLDHDYIDAHTRGFEQLQQFVRSYTVERVSRHSGLSRAAIERAADTIGEASAASFWWTMGVNQSYEGTRTAQALINLALITGNIGRPGTGANSVTGQCNAMGSRLWSNTTNLLGGHDFGNPHDRAKVAEVLDIDVSCIPAEPSWPYDRIMEGIGRGEIRGLWVVATNTAHSWIDQDEARQLLDQLDFLVVQDIYHSTETARHADLILPAAGWGEKEGTLINSERRYSPLKRVRSAPGQALADFSIFRAIAHCWGVGEMFRQWTSPEAAFRIMQSCSRGQPCDITGIENYKQIDRCGGIQWPWSEADAGVGDPEQQRRLFAEGQFCHADGRARLVFEPPGERPEPPDHDYPLVLLTGRGTVSQWHTQTRTSKSPVLRKLYPQQAYVEIHPADAAAANVAHGKPVEVTSRRGSVTATAVVTSAVGTGQVFMPMHYEITNRLTLSHFDPYSRQPSYKDCAVRISPAPHASVVTRRREKK